MAYGIETFVEGVPCIQTVQPFNLVYSIKLVNPNGGSPSLVRNFPIVTGSAADGALIMVPGDLGYYDTIIDLGGNGAAYARGISYSDTNLSMTFTNFFDSMGVAHAHGPLVFNFFRRRG